MPVTVKVHLPLFAIVSGSSLKEPTQQLPKLPAVGNHKDQTRRGRHSRYVHGPRTRRIVAYERDCCGLSAETRGLKTQCHFGRFTRIQSAAARKAAVPGSLPRMT